MLCFFPNKWEQLKISIHSKLSCLLFIAVTLQKRDCPKYLKTSTQQHQSLCLSWNILCDTKIQFSLAFPFGQFSTSNAIFKYIYKNTDFGWFAVYGVALYRLAARRTIFPDVSKILLLALANFIQITQSLCPLQSKLSSHSNLQ